MNKLKLNWIIIFNLQEISTYLDTKTFEEFSLLTKQIRDRSKYRLFNTLKLSYIKFKDYFNFSNLNTNQSKLVTDYSEYLENHSLLFQSEDKCTQESLNNSQFDPLVTNLNKSFSGVANYINYLCVSGFVHCFYALYPITFNLNNLSKLELRFCTIPLIFMLNVGDKLKTLKIIILDNVNLIELTKQELNTNTKDITGTLEILEIEDCFVHIYNTSPKINKLIRTFSYGDPGKLPHLQAIKIPNLKKLSIGNIRPNYIQRLLISNPQIKELTIKNEFCNKEDFIQISISEQLTKLTLFYIESNNPIIKYFEPSEVPIFNYLKSLELVFSYKYDFYVNSQFNILANFPNLTQFSLDLTYFKYSYVDINEFLSANPRALNSPIVLTLNAYERDYDEYSEAWDLYNYDFNYSNFTNVRVLILDLIEFSISEILFNEFPCTLEEVKFKSNDIDSDLDYIRINRMNFINWNVKYNNRYIHFNKLS
ncbi:hypothetical protein CONCODRAFT_170350 [Conidiobolus coronatus NRRL 28638]|uniref:F-box domain-containing protein n=1 Tax=Conidiobolus coronatus (strain ATCC 28846 / CBS 209.66 / NRRL 28638) TaxID=796925 RepID=A0A137NQ27_CONC2|nr:hypothetical protein CONCODRAFT_170350 [Conidiobolus coronatus NRRL 28638]|eukprot:KXN64810.1 hypothetical protein CONCODRAFT_170350 [Conidiobolus coronatus NRRL 28638]